MANLYSLWIRKISSSLCYCLFHIDISKLIITTAYKGNIYLKNWDLSKEFMTKEVVMFAPALKSIGL